MPIIITPELQRIGVTTPTYWPCPGVCRVGAGRKVSRYLFSVNPEYDELVDYDTNAIVDVYLYTNPVSHQQSLVWACEYSTEHNSYNSAELSVVLTGALEGPKLKHGKPTNLYHLFVWIMLASGLDCFTYNPKV